MHEHEKEAEFNVHVQYWNGVRDISTLNTSSSDFYRFQGLRNGCRPTEISYGLWKDNRSKL